MDFATETELDRAARVNLSDAAYSRYLAYKEQVRAQPDCEDILCGFIWDELEAVRKDEEVNL